MALARHAVQFEAHGGRARTGLGRVAMLESSRENGARAGKTARVSGVREPYILYILYKAEYESVGAWLGGAKANTTESATREASRVGAAGPTRVPGVVEQTFPLAPMRPVRPARCK